MAIFQPSNITPDVRAGIGLGVVDATQDLTVSWRITGQSALQSYSITIFTNDAASTQLFTTGQITTGCPAYGTTSAGAPRFFSYVISAADLSGAGIANGNEYKIIIRQWWSENDSVTQQSASVFITRDAPTLSLSEIGTGGVIDTRSYTFTGNYAQAQGDVLNWLRWRLQDAQGNVLADTGNISGTMQLSMSYDGFFPDSSYAVRLSVQTENGAEADTGWVDFSVSYSTTETTGELTAGCVGGTDAVLVEWSRIGYVPGSASGPYSISDDNILTLPTGSSVTWSNSGTGTMAFSAPWSVVYKGEIGYQDANLFTVGQSGGEISLDYDYSAHSLVLSQNGAALATQTGIINTPTITAILTADALYIRADYMFGGLYPAAALYPGAALYPAADDVPKADVYTLSPSYTQSAVTGVSIGGAQTNEFLEIMQGAASAQTVQEAITDGDYTPGLHGTDYMLADWTNGLNAGTLDLGGDTVQGFALYRRQGSSAALVKVAETDVETSRVYDYGALSQQGPYTYYLFPIGSSTYISTPITSGMTMPCWWNWTLMECAPTARENAFTVLAAYRFRLNVETGAISNNNAPTLLQNFTPYPKVQLAPQNYKSGVLTALIGAVGWESGQPEYADTTALRDAIFALSVTQNPLFLKSRKGELIRVRISGAISMQTEDASREQMQTMTLPWAETGDADGVSLYSIQYSGVQEQEGAYVPQFYVDADDATADAANIRREKTAYGPDGKIIGEAQVAVVGTTLIMPGGMEE